MKFLRRADCIIAATEGHITSSPFLTQFREKCRIIPYGIDVQAYRSVERKPILRQVQQNPETVRVLFVGRFVYYKGIEVLLHAFAGVHGCELFLVGHGTPEMEEKLHRMTEEAHMAAQVHFLGNLPEEDLRAAFADCDIFVLPSVANSEAFGIVQQEVFLFADSILENIRYGRLDATDEEVIAAAKAAHAHHFIQTLPGGYDMELNEDASNVSQGQKQLLTIARAILADNPILILDEATSSVDTRTEIRIQKALDNLMKGRTSFVIAHRLSTIKNADMILVMKDGDIIEQGTHDELLAKNGFYAELYNSQFEE